jgi:hypothetical protein
MAAETQRGPTTLSLLDSWKSGSKIATCPAPDDEPQPRRPPKEKEGETGPGVFIRAKAIIKRASLAVRTYGDAAIELIATVAREPEHWLADFLIEPDALEDGPETDPRYRDAETASIADDCLYEIDAPALDCG